MMAEPADVLLTVAELGVALAGFSGIVAILGLMLEEKLKAAGVEAVLVCPGRTNKRYRNAASFLVERLSK